MGVRRTFHFEPKAFAAGELASGFARVLERAFAEGTALDIAVFRGLTDGTEQILHRQPLEAMSSICDLAIERVSLVVGFGKTSEYFHIETRELQCILQAAEDGYLVLQIDTDTPERLRGFVPVIQGELGLAPAPHPRERAKAEIEEGGDPLPPIMELIEELSKRVTALERQNAQRPVPLTCFLSFQFSGVSVEYARQVRHFLELLGVRVITGQGYEPKPLNEKVRERLREQINLVVVIEVSERKSAWTRDEIARAQQPGVFLIPLVESGANFDRGIFGDHEFIEFESGHIGDAFIGLTEGVAYVRRLTEGDLGAALPLDP